MSRKQSVSLESATAEDLYFSASIDAGTFKPSTHGLSKEDFDNRVAYQVLAEHQELEGHTPTAEHLKRVCRDFDYISGVGLSYAAKQMHEEATERRFRSALSRTISELSESGPEAAMSALTSALPSVMTTSKHVGTSLSEFDEEAAEIGAAHIPVPYKPLMMISRGGMRSGQYWLVVARPENGKSWRLVQHAYTAFMAGVDVVFFSMEMTTAEVFERLITLYSKKDGSNMKPDEKAKWRKKMLATKGVGSMKVIDLHDETITPNTVAKYSKEHGLTIVDYLGKMHTGRGGRAAEDHHSMGIVSNALHDIALRQNVAVLAAAQLNRGAVEAERIGTQHIGGSDALGQDADMVIAIDREVKEVTRNTVAKHRHGESRVGWYSEFNAEAGAFDYIPKGQAHKTISMSMAADVDDDANMY